MKKLTLLFLILGLSCIPVVYGELSLNQHLEKGHELLRQKKAKKALPHFREAQKKKPNDAFITLQLGYILDSLNRKKEAYAEFKKLKDSKDFETRKKAQQALLNLSSAHAKLLPEPYFIDVYFSPFFQSRFDNGIFTLNIKGGRTFGKKRKFELYAGNRVVRDTESTGGTAPEIFSDNAVIFSLGLRYQPFLAIPAFIYGEAGRGYDLLDRNRDRWRDDFRSGLTLYHSWGAKPTYSGTWRFPFKHIGNVYGDLGVYSRYDRNWIGYFRIREGLRVIEKNKAVLDVFAQGWFVGDSNDDFFNNLVEYGPGIQFVPNHQWNFAVRFTTLKGTYLRVNSPNRNPFRRKYTDNRWELETYWRF